MIPLTSRPWVLSVRQPWAWLLVRGWKNIENRDRRTNVRGRVLIHACRNEPGHTRAGWDACAAFVGDFAPHLRLPHPARLCYGGIVGEVTVLDCVDAHPSEWFVGRYGYVVDPALSRPLPFLVLPGMPSFFRLPESLCVPPYIQVQQ